MLWGSKSSMHMRYRLLLLLVILIIVQGCKKSTTTPGTPPVVPDPPEPDSIPEVIVKLPESEPPVLTARMDSVSPRILGYYESLPKRYAESKESYPVIIDFHGGGQYGDGNDDLYKVLWFGIPKLIDQGKFPASFTVDGEQWSFIVIAPQLVDHIENVEVLNLLNHIKQKYRTDESRIYITGFSLGGRTAANYAALRPEYFAAMATFGGLPQINDDLQAKCQNMVDNDLPVWHFHNRDDTAWAYSEAEAYIDMFNSLNPTIKPRFTTFDVGQGKNHHDCWTRTTDPAYKEDGFNIYEWMLMHKRE